MNQSQGPAGVIRFGSFEADLRTGELRKGGAKVRIQELPFRVLVALLENQGNLVTREELQKRLWPGDTFVDFDQGLGTAIRKLREALGDSAENPRFIETLPRRGFRFIAPAKGDGVPPGHRDVAFAGGTAIPQRRRRGWPLIAVTTTVTVLMIVAFAYLLSPPRQAPKVIRTTQLTDDRRGKCPIMVTDGSRIYFTEDVKQVAVPSMVSTSGGEVIPLPLSSLTSSLSGPVVLDLSTDGQELLLVKPTITWPGTDGALWVVPTAGGVARRLGDLLAFEAVWSPDGKKLLYSRTDDHHLYLANSDGTNPHALTIAPSQPYFIRWSPDGKRISLSADDGRGHNTLWEVSADGSNLHPALAGWDSGENAESGRWTPDGRYLLFDSSQGGSGNIWAIREGQRRFLHKPISQPVQVTTGPVSIGNPLPSKDGKRIFVTSSVEHHPELYRYDPKSNEWKPFLSGIAAEHLDISRDGQWATYISYPEASLFRSKMDGSEKLQLTSPPVEAAMPRFSPDAKQIAYMARAPGERWRIWLAPSSPGISRRLMSDGQQKQTDPTWSPDGKKLAFHQSDSSTSPKSEAIYVFDLASKQLSVLPGSSGKNSPRWSPSGRNLAAMADDYHKLMLFDFKAQRWTFLAKNPLNDQFFQPQWSHDGKFVYFFYSTDTPINYCFRARVQDGKVETAFNIDAPASVAHGAFGAWNGLITPDGSLLTLLDQQYSEIYALDWQAP